MQLQPDEYFHLSSFKLSSIKNLIEKNSKTPFYIYLQHQNIMDMTKYFRAFPAKTKIRINLVIREKKRGEQTNKAVHLSW